MKIVEVLKQLADFRVQKKKGKKRKRIRKELHRNSKSRKELVVFVSKPTSQKRSHMNLHTSYYKSPRGHTSTHFDSTQESGVFIQGHDG